VSGISRKDQVTLRASQKIHRNILMYKRTGIAVPGKKGYDLQKRKNRQKPKGRRKQL